ncbi:PSD1 and planctomycete cytochrome C domain-containing protein [Prosthecobacter vanneervenii]|uniref:Mono/diheme cytochrome c family protein n=1 Tax=Prosthecobacter vanneervenii TaxID=48466 RepID=A0A7W7YC65_9BACT|nr:PSD1 and planctomycete cytochrome C domain-containing protein [Prosthecobacter vanneervenii]MBB5033479.1 mono/diheme cytochrome c family protein [Prosthecobacter vanneervenii]
MTTRQTFFISLLLAASSLHAEDAEALFVRRIWPLFQEKCLACHGNDEKKIKGGYDMRTQESAMKGGESEKKSIIPGRPEDSPLYLASTRQHADDWEPMPPKEADKLYAEQLGWIKIWIAEGAPWPDETKRAAIAKANAEKWSAEDGIVVKTSGALSPEWASRRYKPEGLWAYQPVKKPAVPAGQHPIDFLLAVKDPAPAADPRTFIRRATFDLTGLPPTPEEVAAFEQSYSKDPASSVQHLVNRLLDSPHYGERMARHWLDVTRYADSSGFANDYERGNAWRYRDYVVRSFNADKPYDHFIKEQIAGDEMQQSDAGTPARNSVAPATTPASEGSAGTLARNSLPRNGGIPAPSPANSELLIATGFLRMGPWELTSMEVAKIARQRFLDDVTNSVGETFLAHSLQCARCHDHKFDPVPTHDYYAIQACFGTTQLVERPAPFLPVENTTGFEEKKYLESRRDEHLAMLARLDEKMLANASKWYAEKNLDRSAWDKAVTSASAFIAGGGKMKKGRSFTGVFETARAALQKQNVPEDQYPPKLVGFEPEDYGNERVARKGLERLKWELERYEPFAFSVYDGLTPQVTSINQPIRMPQSPMTTGELEKTAILSGGDPFSPLAAVKPGVLSVLNSIEFSDAITGRRTALANWIASKDNPLTARVIVNRLWLWHFGQAIAGNPNNFGSTGKKPTHPALLDWLAATLMEKNWSIKEMHRIIMTSATYQRSAKFEGSAGTPARSADKISPLTREEAEKTYAVFKPRRLMAEELRDAMLSITGEFNPALGGIPNRPEINIEVAMQPRQVMGTFAAAWVPNALPAQRHRRSLYALKIRGVRDPFMEVFNEPAPDFSCEAREVSTVTPQVFSLFNGQASYSRALALANRVLKEKTPDAITRIFQLTYGRAPSADEKNACTAHWQAMEKKQTGLTFPQSSPPLTVKRDAVEENTGEKFSFQENLPGYADFVPDLQSADVDARTRALADVCLVLLNSNEFAYLY